MWSFSSLFPSPGLSDLNGRSGVTKAQGAGTVTQIANSINSVQMLHWQTAGRTAILASVIP